MICPGSGSDNEMAYSVLSYGFICLESACSYEVEMAGAEALEIIRQSDEPMCV